MAPTLTLLQVPVEDSPPSVEPAHPSLNATHLPQRSPEGAARRRLPPLPDLPAVAPVPLSNRVLPAEAPGVTELQAAVPVPPRSPAGWFILPLVWGNRLFDHATQYLGETGAWLRGPTGRGAVGAAGLILLAAAALWLTRDWLGLSW